MDNVTLQTLVENSYLLSNEQRAYWITQLPLMDEGRKTKLADILKGSDQVPFQKQLEGYLSSLGQAAAGLYGTAPKAA